MKMKMSANLKHEIKLHLFWLRSTIPGLILYVLSFNTPMFDHWPLWASIAGAVLFLVAHYCWWRQCLSPDKKTFTPRIWK
jgi:hypothetical protein